jgi:hypothetical protein
MNYFGHVALASEFSSSPEFLLGSMLPDLGSIIHVPTPHCASERVARGVRFHLLTDDEFHKAEAFRSEVESTRRTLELMGLRKAPARAASHIGVELTLDAVLGRSALHQLAFKCALTVAGPRGLAAHLQWTSETAPERFETLRLRLLERSACRDFFAKDRLADRLVYALSRRPRLALSTTERTAVYSWIHGPSAPRTRELVVLWNRVRERVGASWQRQVGPDSTKPNFSVMP